MNKELNDYLQERLARRAAVTGGALFMDDMEPEVLPPTEAELRDMASYEMKQVISECIRNIDGYGITPDKDDATYQVLLGYRAELIGLRTLPGTMDAISSEVLRITTAVNDIMDYQFRFETL